MILVDSSVRIDYFNGQQTWKTNLLDNLLSDVPIINSEDPRDKPRGILSFPPPLTPPTIHSPMEG